MAIESRNPATGELIRAYEPHTSGEVERILKRAEEAFRRHRATPFEQRASWMRRAAAILEHDKRDLAALMTTEMGKPIGAAVAEAEKCAWVCEYYAEHAEAFLTDEIVTTSAARSYIRYEPLGPILAIMPWNFPFWQVFRFAAPALMAGNVGILKHAGNVPGSALAIEEIFRRAGFPEGVFQTLFLEPEDVAPVLDDPRVRAATLTGSTRAGSAVASRAGERIKKMVLELGGSDPFIVMPSADLESTIRTAVVARTINNGQSCIAAKRFIVHADIYERFVDGFVKRMGELKVGDPMDEGTHVGPLATPAILDGVDRQVRRCIEAGARVLIGGERIDRPGNFYAPTALDQIPPGTPARTEEIFGPVAAIFRVATIDEAIDLANDTRFGLGSSVWTRDASERDRFVAEIEAGQVFVNAMVASDPRLPFGGVKESGFGRELGVWGVREFANVKTVWIGGAPRGWSE